MLKKLSFVLFLTLISNGYCLAADKKAPAKPTKAAAVEYVSIAQDKATIRSGPGEKNDVILNLEAAKFYPLKVLSRKDKWIQFEDFEGDKGWIAESATDKKTKTVIVFEKANVREKPDKSAKMLWAAGKGETFKVLQRKGDWLEVIDPVSNKGWLNRTLVWGNNE